MTTSEKIERKLPTVPDMPGAYMMKDAEGTIVYVGKAIACASAAPALPRDRRYGWTTQLYAV